MAVSEGALMMHLIKMVTQNSFLSWEEKKKENIKEVGKFQLELKTLEKAVMHY